MTVDHCFDAIVTIDYSVFDSRLSTCQHQDIESWRWFLLCLSSLCQLLTFNVPTSNIRIWCIHCYVCQVGVEFQLSTLKVMCVIEFVIVGVMNPDCQC